MSVVSDEQENIETGNLQYVTITLKTLSGNDILTLELLNTITIEELFFATKSELRKNKKLPKGHKIELLQNSIQLSSFDFSTKLAEIIDLTKSNHVLSIVMSQSGYRLAVIYDNDFNNDIIQIYNPRTNNLFEMQTNLGTDFINEVYHNGFIKFDQKSDKVTKLVYQSDCNLGKIKNYDNISIPVNDPETKKIIRNIFSNLTDNIYENLKIYVCISVCGRYVGLIEDIQSSSETDLQLSNIWLIDRKTKDYRIILTLEDAIIIRFDNSSISLCIYVHRHPDREFIVINLSSLEQSYTLSFHNTDFYFKNIYMVHFDEDILITHSKESLDIWKNGNLERHINNEDIFTNDHNLPFIQVCISPDLKYLALSYVFHQQPIILYNLETNQLVNEEIIKSIRFKLSPDSCSALFFIPDE